MNLTLSFLYYSFVSGITPGPANISSLSTAIRHGKSVALKQWRGLFAGYFTVSMISAVLTWLIGTAFSRYIRYFTFIGAAYILWLAFHILRDKGTDIQNSTKKLHLQEGTFWFGFLLQATNVKVIIFCLTIFTGYVLPYRQDLLSLFLVGLLLPFIGPVCNLAWLLAGSKLQSLFDRHRKLINRIMAASLVICAISMVR